MPDCNTDDVCLDWLFVVRIFSVVSLHYWFPSTATTRWSTVSEADRSFSYAVISPLAGVAVLSTMTTPHSAIVGFMLSPLAVFTVTGDGAAKLVSPKNMRPVTVRKTSALCRRRISSNKLLEV